MPLDELLRRLAERGTDLGEARIRMVRAELARDVGVLVRRLALFAAAALLLVFGLQFLTVAAVLALATQLGGWLAALLFSVLFLIAGAAAFLAARSRAGAPFLEGTLEALGEDLRWLAALLL